MNQPRVSVVFLGASGAVQHLAKEVAQGAEGEGALVRVRRIADHAVPNGGQVGFATPDDVRWADAVVLGTPSRYGNVAPQLRAYLDALDVPSAGDLRPIVWSGFATDDGVLHGGREVTLMALFRALFHLGGVLVPTPSGRDPIDGAALARRTGRDVARVARRLQAGAAAEITHEIGVR